MTYINTKTRTHPTELELADFLNHTLSTKDRGRIEDHIAICEECLEKAVSAHESVAQFNKIASMKKRKDDIMKKINPYLILAIVSFLVSFTMPRYFIQFLVATLVLGIKWIVDSKTTKMLIMIYEAWKKGGEQEASRILQTFDSRPNSRF